MFFYLVNMTAVLTSTAAMASWGSGIGWPDASHPRVQREKLLKTATFDLYQSRRRATQLARRADELAAKVADLEALVADDRARLGRYEKWYTRLLDAYETYKADTDTLATSLKEAQAYAIAARERMASIKVKKGNKSRAVNNGSNSNSGNGGSSTDNGNSDDSAQPSGWMQARDQLSLVKLNELIAQMAEAKDDMERRLQEAEDLIDQERDTRVAVESELLALRARRRARDNGNRSPTTTPAPAPATADDDNKRMTMSDYAVASFASELGARLDYELGGWQGSDDGSNDGDVEEDEGANRGLCLADELGELNSDDNEDDDTQGAAHWGLMGDNLASEIEDDLRISLGELGVAGNIGTNTAFNLASELDACDSDNSSNSSKTVDNESSA